MPPRTTAKVKVGPAHSTIALPTPPARGPAQSTPNNLLPYPADGLAYSALLKNELLGAGIEKVQDPQTEDRRLQPSTPEHKGLFTVSQRQPGPREGEGCGGDRGCSVCSIQPFLCRL